MKKLRSNGKGCRGRRESTHLSLRICVNPRAAVSRVQNRAHVCRVQRRREEWEQENGILKPTVTARMRARKETEELATPVPNHKAVALQPLVDALKQMHTMMNSSSDSDSDTAWSDEDDEEAGTTSVASTLAPAPAPRRTTNSGGERLRRAGRHVIFLARLKQTLVDEQIPATIVEALSHTDSLLREQTGKGLTETDYAMILREVSANDEISITDEDAIEKICSCRAALEHIATLPPTIPDQSPAAGAPSVGVVAEPSAYGPYGGPNEEGRWVNAKIPIGVPIREMTSWLKRQEAARAAFLESREGP